MTSCWFVLPGACEGIVVTHKCHDAVNEKGVSEKVSATGSGLFPKTSVREGQRNWQRPVPLSNRTEQTRPFRFVDRVSRGPQENTGCFCVQPVIIAALSVLLTICVCPSGRKGPIRHSCVTLCVSFVLSFVLRRHHTTLIERNEREFRTNDNPGFFRLTHKQTPRLVHSKGRIGDECCSRSRDALLTVPFVRVFTMNNLVIRPRTSFLRNVMLCY